MKFRSFLVFLAASLTLAPAFADLPEPVKARALAPGDTIALAAPSGNIGEERKETLIDGLTKMGFKVKAMPNILDRTGYLAGDDEARAASIMDAWRDPEVNAIFCVTGGYGATRMVDALDYDFIAENPKILTGFSDITALHLAIQAKTGLVTFHSPTTAWAYINNKEERPVQTQYLWRAIDSRQYAPESYGYPIDGYAGESEPEAITIGKAIGYTTGGNLSLIHALMGTEYEIQTDNRIVFIEDVGEEPYRIDRMLSNMRLAGKLDNPAAVLLGQFARCEPDNPERSFTIDEVFDHYFQGASYPVVKGFPTGHVIDNATIPMGVQAEFNTRTMELTILEDPVIREEN